MCAVGFFVGREVGAQRARQEMIDAGWRLRVRLTDDRTVTVPNESATPTGQADERS